MDHINPLSAILYKGDERYFSYMTYIVSRWLPTAAVRGSSPGLVIWDFVVDKVALGQVFSEYFGFPCQFLFHQSLQKSSSSSGVCTIGQKWPQYFGT
jgi:hypothetical protein